MRAVRRRLPFDASAAIVDVPAAGATHAFVVDDALRQAIARGAKEL